MHRATTKPRGYPGDFEILEALYDQQAKSKGIGEALDLYFLSTSLGRAVNCRKNKCREMLETLSFDVPDSPLRILSIACGPCRELQEWTALQQNQLLSYTGIDYDEAALSYAKTHLLLHGFKDNQLTFRRENVLRMVTGEKNVEKFGTFDLIYSVGLYDYLADNALCKVLGGTAHMLKDGGRYVIAFKDATRYDKTEYQWHIDWHFYQRTYDECLALINHTGLKILRMEREKTGVIMFFTLVR